MKKIILSCLSMCMLLLLTACGSKFNHTEYIKGLLDNTYLNDSVLLIENVKISEEDATKEYEDKIQTEIDYFLKNIVGIEKDNEISEDTLNELKDVYKEIYSHAKYEVSESEKIDDTTYKLTVTVSPMNIISLCAEEFDAAFNEEFSNWDETNDPEFAQFDQKFTERCIEILKSRISSINYETAQTFEITLKKEDVWTITDNVLSKIDECIIDYSIYN